MNYLYRYGVDCQIRYVNHSANHVEFSIHVTKPLYTAYQNALQIRRNCNCYARFERYIITNEKFIKCNSFCVCFEVKPSFTIFQTPNISFLRNECVNYVIIITFGVYFNTPDSISSS